ncbi:MAG TPA: hypothetical protein EYP17_02020 [Candidatus Latescibacteria bacterium]|nr:hypothetical protein [Candidatus Latescibacterota bacterium]
MGISGGRVIYRRLSEVSGPLIVVEGGRDVGYGEIAEVTGPDGRPRRGMVLEVGERLTVVQVFQGTSGLTARPSASRPA